MDVTDGYTAVFEVYEVDAVNNRLVFRTPVMTDSAQQDGEEIDRKRQAQVVAVALIQLCLLYTSRCV